MSENQRTPGEQLIALEDEIKGRVIPSSRFWSAYAAIIAAIAVARVAPHDFGWTFVCILIGGMTYSLLLRKYVRRSIK